MNADALKTFVQARLPPQLPAEAVDDFISSRLLAQPVPFGWIARSLRNLRYVYANANDDVRLLGAAERLLLLANAQAESSNAGSTAAAVAPGGGSSSGGTSSSGRGAAAAEAAAAAARTASRETTRRRSQRSRRRRCVSASARLPSACAA